MKIPRHIGIIMDGNGRWAKKRGLPRAAGHRAGTSAMREIVQVCGEMEISYLTTYTFSTENWGRPSTEVSMLMDLFLEMIRKEIKNLNSNNVRLMTIGDLSKVPAKTRQEFFDGMELTKNNTGLTLILAINYGGRAEIVNAVKSFTRKVIENPSLVDSLDEKQFGSFMYTGDIPDPELIIRTGGDIRLSNFLLWQSAYAELHVTDVLWPDFNKECLLAALKDFSSRDRRFGKVKE